jgi:acetyl-CoA acetyltransferase
MRRDVLVLDGEVGAFGKRFEGPLLDTAEGVAATLLARHPELRPRVGCVVVGAGMSARSDGRESGLAQSLATRLGLGDAAGVDVRAFCASGNAAVIAAATTIEAERADVVLVVGADHATSEAIPVPLKPEAVGVEADYDFSPPVFYGLVADRYLAETDATLTDLAAIAVRNRAAGASNPRARFQAETTIEEVLGSATIAPPLTKLQCCASADGAGALLLAAADAVPAAEAAGAVRLAGHGTATNPSPLPRDLLSFEEDAIAARRAYEEAGAGPEEVIVAEVHDAFTISQAVHLEDIGLAARGEGWREPRAGLSVNPSGGLLSRGHPLGATGIAQVESVRAYLDRHRDGIGVVQEAGGIQVLGQILSTCMVFEPAAGVTR